MSKLILVVRLPLSIPKDTLIGIAMSLNKRIVNYYNILAFVKSNVEKITFEVYNVQDVNPIDFKTLKNKLKNIQNMKYEIQ